MATNTWIYRPTALTDTFCIGAAVMNDGVTIYAGAFFSLFDAINNEVQVELYQNTDGTISVRRGATVIATTTEMIDTNVWFYLEFLVNIHASTGSYTLRRDGVTLLTDSGVNTRGGTVAQANRAYLHGRGPTSAGPQVNKKYDDFVLQSGAASALLGDCRVDTFFPDADGASSQFTPSTGTDNYAMVDEGGPTTDPDFDTTYVESSTIGHIDLYAYPSLTHTPATIHAVQFSQMVKKSESGYRSMKPVLRSGGVNYEGDEKVLGADTYIWVPTVHETDPNTATAWTIAGVNAIEAGQKVEA
jgi:hypothetical protein